MELQRQKAPIYTLPNTRPHKRGSRYCKTCDKDIELSLIQKVTCDGQTDEKYLYPETIERIKAIKIQRERLRAAGNAPNTRTVWWGKLNKHNEVEYDLLFSDHPDYIVEANEPEYTIGDIIPGTDNEIGLAYKVLAVKKYEDGRVHFLCEVY
jgi:hypothetical protein